MNNAKYLSEKKPVFNADADPPSYYESKEFKDFQTRILEAVKAGEKRSIPVTFSFLIRVVGNYRGWLWEAAKGLVGNGLYVTGSEILSRFHTTEPDRQKDLGSHRRPQKTARAKMTRS